MRAPRLSLERQVFARLLGAPDLTQLRRWLFALRLLGVRFTGDLGRAFIALGALVERGEAVSVEAVAHAARVDRDGLRWVAVAYQSAAPLQALTAALHDADRAASVDSVARCLLNATREGGDLDRAIAVALASLRRLRGPA